MEPLVSIIVPVFNSEKTIKRCIDSILNQKFHDFELLLINDGSSDMSGQICDEYSKIDDRVKVIHKNNSGVSDTRNRGIAEARGKYLQFIDSDDWLTQDATGLFVRTAEENGCDMVIADFYRVVGERVAQKGAIEEDGLLDRVAFAEIMMQKPADFYYGVLWNKLYNRSIIEKHHLKMDSSVSWCEDFMFNLEYLRNIQTIYALKVPIYYYVKTKGSLVSQGMSVKNTIQMKRTVFGYYKTFFKDVFDEEDYEKCKIQVYRFLIDAASDGVVAPVILPGNYKLGFERTSVSEGVQEGEGYFFDYYREHKMIEKLFEVIALRNELSIVDIKLIYFLSQPHKNCTLKEIANILNVTRTQLTMSIQGLVSREYIKIKEPADGKTKEKKNKEKSQERKNKDKSQETKKKNAALDYFITPESEHILAEIMVVLDDFDQIQYDGFSREEIEIYEKLNEKRNYNIRRGIK